MESVTIRPDGRGRLLVGFPHSKARVEPVERMSGRQRNSDAKIWSVPDTSEVRQALAEMFTAPPPPQPGMEYIPVAPSKSELRSATKPRARFTPGKPLTTNPPHPLLKVVDDELVLRCMAYGTRKSYGQHLRDYLDWLKVKPQDASREDIRAYLVRPQQLPVVLRCLVGGRGRHAVHPGVAKAWQYQDD